MNDRILSFHDSTFHHCEKFVWFVQTDGLVIDYQKQFVRTLLAYAVQRDIPADQLCRSASIDLETLRSGRELDISPKQINDLWLNVGHLSQDTFFGLHLGESMQLTALGIVGELIKTSRSIGEGVTNAAAFGNLLTDVFQMIVDNNSKTFKIRFIPNEQARSEYPETFRQMMDLSLVLTIHELDGLVLKKISPRCASLPLEESQRNEYTRTLRCEVTKSNEYKLEFDAQLWNEPIITANYELQVSLLDFATKELRKNHFPSSLKQRISQYLITHAYLGMPTMEEIASNFNMSARTFQRRLQQEDVTYHEISDGIRRSLALNYLHSGKYQLKEISVMLGYNELSAFARAFKRWTGNSPAKYQQGLSH
ncbi:MAG: AraC family transcriptional regulator ligand-binding domain-containing protein [Chryseolinea sp.]